MSQELKTKILLLNPKAVVPQRAHDTDTGYDLTFIGVDKIVGDTIFFKTGISVQPPEGYYFDVVPRSSISKLPLQMSNSVGIIDEHYRGEIMVPVRVLHSDMGADAKANVYPNGIVRFMDFRPRTMMELAEMILKRKPTLFQMILRKRIDTEFEVVSSLDDTKRGSGGFGSTD